MQASIGLVGAAIALLALAAYSEMATVPVSADIGAQPTSPDPHPTLIPT